MPVSMCKIAPAYAELFQNDIVFDGACQLAFGIEEPVGHGKRRQIAKLGDAQCSYIVAFDMESCRVVLTQARNVIVASIC